MQTVITMPCIVILLIRTQVQGNGVKQSFLISGTSRGGVVPDLLGDVIDPVKELIG